VKKQRSELTFVCVCFQSAFYLNFQCIFRKIKIGLLHSGPYTGGDTPDKVWGPGNLTALEVAREGFSGPRRGKTENKNLSFV
jgi:hypothetical protein